MHFPRLSFVKKKPILNVLTQNGTSETNQSSGNKIPDSGESAANESQGQGYWQRVKALTKLKMSGQSQNKGLRKVLANEDAIVKNNAMKPMELIVNTGPYSREFYEKGEELLRKYIMQIELDQEKNMKTSGNRNYDKECLPYILGALNEAGANIAYFRDASSLIDIVGALQEDASLCTHVRGILWQDGHISRGHHLFCDVYIEGGKGSLILLDSIRPSGMDDELLDEFDCLEIRIVVSYWDMRIQNSSANCLIFALSNAKKAIDEKDFFLELHKKQINNKSISAKPVWSMDGDAPFSSCWDLFCMGNERKPNHEDRSKYVLHYPLLGGGNLRLMGEGGEIFPARFFKHSEPRSTLERLKILQPNLDLDTKKINKKNQTIFQRWDAHKTTREIKKQIGKSQAYELHKIQFSRSIEEKRLSFLRSALEHVIGMKHRA